MKESETNPVTPGDAEAIAVIVLSFNQKDMTLRCLESLLSIRDIAFTTVLWDNGSSDGTVEAVRDRFPSVLAHRSDSNLGVASGRNAAARLAMDRFSPSYLLFLDNDMVVEPDFVSKLLEPFQVSERVGQTQAKLRFMKDPERLNDGGGCDINFVLGRTRPVGFGEIDRGQYDRRRSCVSCGGAMMVRSGLFESHGGFDTMFDPFGPEDLDFSLRLQKAGYESVFVPEAVAYHEVSHTFGADYSAVYARHKMRHWLLFMRRHASRWKITLFFLITAPWLLLRVVAREGLRGNFAAVGGLARGVWDSVPIGRKPAGRTRGENGNLPAESSSRRANNPGA